MKRTPGLIACAILLWGWQSGYWLPALALAVLQESLPWLPWRWKAENTAQRTRLLIRCTWASLVWLGAQSAYLVLVQRNAGNMPVVTWFPWSLLPLVLALQTEQRPPGREFDMSLISALLDKKSDEQGDPGLALPLLPLWLACWLFAAACAATDGVWFYPLCSLCVAVLLWQERPQARSARLWLLLMLAAISLGAVLNLGLFKLQGVLEEWAVDWLLARPQDDPVRSQTALGHIGQLKLSERVILQVNPADERTRPQSILLMNASYNIYQNGVWRLTGNNSFVDLRQELHPGADKSGAATIGKQLPNLERAWFVPHGQSGSSNAHAGATPQKLSILLDTSQTHMLLPLPLGTHSIRAGNQANLHGVSYNPLGSVQGFMQAGQVLFFAEYDGYAHESAPGPKDMQIPETEAAQLQAILREANIDRGLEAAQVLPRLQAFFSQHFRYSTWRDGNASGRSAVADFLSRNRSGHCEHFATSTVLLLRAVGIPARYATGYLAQEPANFGPGLIVRQRHAHAWVRVYVQDRWQDFDTTPAAWLIEDEHDAHAAWLQQAWFELNAAWYRYRQQAADSGRVPVQYMLLGLGVLILAWILIRRRYGAKLKLQLVNQAAPADARHDQLQQSMQALQQHLAHCALGRMTQESLLQWLQRIQPLLKPQAAAQLGELLQAYYQLRFAPAPQPDSQAWRKAAADWCQAWPEPGLQSSPQVTTGRA